MPWTDSQAASLALLTMYAADMLEQAERNNQLVSALTKDNIDPRIAQDWDVLGFFYAPDILFKKQADLGLDVSTAVFGFLARSRANDKELVAALRGTEGLLDWLKDAEFAEEAHPLGCKVELGFYSIYSSMSYAPLDGAVSPASEGVAGAMQDGDVLTVTGHSLGAALGAYLAIDLAAFKHKKPAVSACFFASPCPGDVMFAKDFQFYVPDHRVYDYTLDVVPKLPPLFGYTALPNLTSLPPKDDVIEMGLECNHHALCYAWLLAPEVVRPAVRAIDDDCKVCIKNF